MSVVEELIRTEADGTLSFGNYKLTEKSKKSDFMYNGDSYKVKTFNEITKLERNGMFVYESVPGTAVNNFVQDAKKTSFCVSGNTDVQITLEMEEGSEYEVTVDGDFAGKMKTNFGGKIVISVDMNGEKDHAVSVVKA